MIRLLTRIFACHHANKSRIFRLFGESYQVCLTCGKHVEPKVRLGK